MHSSPMVHLLVFRPLILFYKKYPKKMFKVRSLAENSSGTHQTIAYGSTVTEVRRVRERDNVTYIHTGFIQ